MNNKPETPFVNVMIYPGQYALYFVQENGKLIRIEQVATSKRPYEIFFDYANRPYSIIKRFDDRYTNGNARLYLVNNRDGSVPAECKYGTEEIRYCTTFGDIYFCPICQNGKSQSKNVVHMPRFGAVKTAEKLPNPLLGNILTTRATMRAKPLETTTITPHTPKRGTTPARPEYVITGIIKPGKNHHYASLKKVSHSEQNNAFYDVYVNGERVVQNRMNVTAETFMDDSVLVVKYTMPDLSGQRCLVYLPNGTEWTFERQSRLDRRQNTYIYDVAMTKKRGLRLKTKYGSDVFLSAADIAKYKPAQYIIENANQDTK